MAYRNPTFGRTHHLANLDIDYDTDSPSYGHSGRYMSHGPVPDGETLAGQDGIGTWRLPQRPEQCAEVLWRFWYIPTPTCVDDKGKGKQRGEQEMVDDAERLAGEVLCYLQDVWYRSTDLAKKVSAKVQQREHTPFRNLSPNADPLSDPVDVVAARLTERWLYLRSKELVGLTIYVLHKFEAYLKAVMGDVEWMTTWPADYVAYARTNDLIKPLEESLLFAENDKDEGNQYFRQGSYAHAALQYLNGLSNLAPWYPLEWIMPAWESELNGLTNMVFGLLLNLARCAVEMNEPELGQLCTFPVVRHPFATNRHMRKAWHLFGRAVALYMMPGTREIHAMPPSQLSTILVRHTLAFRQARFFSHFDPKKRWRQPEGGDFGLGDIEDAASILGQLTPQDHGACMLDLLVPTTMRRYQELTLRASLPREVWENWTEDEDIGWADIHGWYGDAGLPAAGKERGPSATSGASGDGALGGVWGEEREDEHQARKDHLKWDGEVRDGGTPERQARQEYESGSGTPMTDEDSPIMGWSPGRYGRGELTPPVWLQPESPVRAEGLERIEERDEEQAVSEEVQ